MRRLFTVKKKTLFFMSALPLSVAGVWFFSHTVEPIQSQQAMPGTLHTIELREDGFYPDPITVSVGSTITFTTARGEEFWPASNLHPTHTVYPEFDPREPIASDESWSFTFNETGSWRYHDHLAPIYTGIITVVAQSNEADSTSLPASFACRDLSLRERILCFEEQLVSVVHESGLEQAFTLLSHIYDSEPELRPSCHGYAHTLGEEAYRVFSENGALDFVPEAPLYCGAGFYHGFMETMLIATGDITAARDLCTYVGETIGGDAKGACYHGIGHGVTDGGDPRAWGVPQAMIENGLTLCERTGEDERYIGRCVSGVFNSLGIYFNNKYYEEYSLRVDPEDPYAICREQKKPYFKKACYEELDTTVFRLNGNDLAQSLKYAERITSGTYAAVATEALASFSFFVTGIDEFDEAHILAICRDLERGLNIDCIRGIGVGLVEFGPPEREYKAGLQFCQSERLSTAEREDCLDRVVSYVQVLSTPRDFEHICREAIHASYRAQYCI